MAEIKIRLEINPNAEIENEKFLESTITNFVGGVGSNSNISNASIKASESGVFDKIPTEQFGGREMLFWAKNENLAFDSNGTLINSSGNVGYLVSEENPESFVWGIVGDNSGNIKIVFSNAKVLKDIVIVGDSVANQFPTEAIIDDTKTVFSDDNKFEIAFDEEADTHSVEFTKWNRQGYNAVITQIRVGLRYYELGNSELISIESLSQSTGQPKEIFYGATPSSGSAEINDINKKLQELINASVIPNSNLPIEIFANGKQVQKHITSDSSYDNNALSFKVQLQNKLSQWDSLQYGGLELATNEIGTPVPRKAYELLVDFLSSTGYSQSDIDEMLDGEIVYGGNNVVGTVKDYLLDLEIPVPYLESGSVRQVADRFCTLAQLNVMENDNGEIKFVSARPVRSGYEPIIVIPPKNQFSALEKDVIIKNKYDGVELSAKQVKDEINYDVNVYTYKTDENLIVVQQQGDEDFDYDDYYGAGTVFIETISFVKIDEINYAQGTLTFNKKAGRETILNVKDGLNKKDEFNIKHILKCRKITGNVIATANKDGINKISYIPLNEDTISINMGEQDLILQQETKTSNISSSIVNVSLNNLTNLADIKLDFDSNWNCNVNYKILSKKRLTRLSQKGQEDISAGGTIQFTNVYNIEDDNWIGYEEYIPLELEVSFYGDKRVISFEDLNLGYGKTQNVISLQGNTLTQQYDGKETHTHISKNILEDYKNGISTAKVTISCSNYYDENGQLVKDWANGEILQVGDIVRLDKDNNGNTAFVYGNGSTMLWKVTGRKFRNNGVPLVDLELQEVIKK